MSSYKMRKYREQSQRLEARAKKRIMIGLFLAIFGTVITAATHSSPAFYGGVIVIAYGPIIGGIYYIIKGLWELSSS